MDLRDGPRAAAALTLALGAAACAGAARRPAEPPLSAFGGLARFAAAPGWTPSDRSLWGADTVVLSSGTETTIRLHLREGDPEKDELVKALRGPAADDPSVGPARDVETVRVAGTDVELWRRYSGGVREEPQESPTYFAEEFCVVPLEGRFLLLVFEAESHGRPVWGPRLEALEAGWRSLLASLRVER